MGRDTGHGFSKGTPICASGKSCSIFWDVDLGYSLETQMAKETTER